MGGWPQTQDSSPTSGLYCHSFSNVARLSLFLLQIIFTTYAKQKPLLPVTRTEVNDKQGKVAKSYVECYSLLVKGLNFIEQTGTIKGSCVWQDTAWSSYSVSGGSEVVVFFRIFQCRGVIYPSMLVLIYTFELVICTNQEYTLQEW